MNEDQSRLAAWGSRLAILGLVVLVVCIVLLRFDLMAFRLPLLGIAVAGLLGIVALVVSLIGLVSVLRGKRAGLSAALIGIVVALVAATPFTTSFMKGRSVPPIHDITTDLANPPQFVAILPLRATSPNPLDRAEPADLAAQQAKAYPSLAPVTLDALPGKVFEASRDVVHDMGWDLVSAAPDSGLIEATATTNLLHFKDDVVIRITETDAGGSIVDLRSVSRVGMSDLGANAARIEAFIEALKAKLAS
tara:strand:+ start:1545 stop:2291 length:747 start_codon:yes stop_codon:yes gene_type:complete